MAIWTKKPFRYVLVGLVSGSAARPYEVVVTEDTRDGRRFISCNCMSWTRGRRNKGLKNYQRSCKHTVNFTVDSPEIDFDGPLPAHIPPEVKDPTGRIGFVKPMLPARWRGKYETEVYDNPDWVATVKMDGHRCLVVKQPYGKVEFFSRGGKRMMSVEPAFQDLQLSKGIMLDTELCVRDVGICSCSRKNRKAGFDTVAHFRAEHSSALKIVVLDVLYVNGLEVMGQQLSERIDMAANIVDKINDPRVEMVEAKPANTLTADWLRELVERGEEGCVFKRKSGPYLPGIRSSEQWLKWKPPQIPEIDVAVVGVLPPTQKTPGYRLAYGYSNGVQVGVLPDIRGTLEEMEQHVGRVAVCRANEILPSGALLYPRFEHWHPSKMPCECIRSVQEA